jgi:hypothetical protein
MTTPGRSAHSGSSERLGELLDGLDLEPIHKAMLRDRWLDQVRWMTAKARQSRRNYYLLRLPTVVGGVAVPGVVSLTLATVGQPLFETMRWVTFGFSLSVAILAALDELFHYGERWRHFRRTAEVLKGLGWQFLMLNGAFARYPTHEEAFRAFTTRVEEVLGEDVEGYLGAMTSDGADRERHEIYH